MGLDATAYKNVELLEVMPDVEEWEEKYFMVEGMPETVRVYINSDFPGWENKIRHNGVYKYDSAETVSIGYGSHKTFRDMLSKMAIGYPAETIWNNPGKYTKAPFFRFINFSDCEGIIGTKYCKSLAKDFADWQWKVDEMPDDWFRSYYAEWRKVFETAAENGFVDFH